MNAVSFGPLRRELHAAWNPVDAVQSARRSRVLVLETTLVRTTDSLDMYMALLRRSPAVIQDRAVQASFDASGNSVLKRFFVIKDVVTSLDPILSCLTELMIVWRNRLVHSLADNQVSPAVWSILSQNEDKLSAAFSGMRLDRLESGFKTGEPPTFKETASFIRATHADGYFLAALDTAQFLRDLIWATISKGSSDDLDSIRKRRIQSIWGRDASERVGKVVAFLTNAGLSAHGDASATEFDDDLINSVSNKSPRELFSYLSPNCT